MRKTINRTTVIVVLALFLCLSVGYALFSDTITIEGTATAQGNFDMTITCQTGYSEDLINDGFFEDLPDVEQIGFENDTCIVSDDIVTANVELKQPGSEGVFTINIKNTGSMDAYLEVNPETEGPAIFDENFITTELTNISTGEVTSKSYNFIGFDFNEEFYTSQFPRLEYVEFLLKLADGSYTDGFYDMKTQEPLEETLFYVDSGGKYYLKLAPNDTLISIPVISWASSASTQGYSSKTTFTMPFDFIQKTSDMTLDPDAEVCMIAC